ncbi:MAG TPA: hypothetical protein VHG51_16680 [Longimicrobiaceae bacterium]|nr:hypothetical protein [Longimicrobiaceae bacterium]
MKRRREAPSIEQIRQTAELRVRETSLRQVAYGVGLSPMGLKKFLDGASPYEANRRKLSDWYVRERARSDAATPDPTVATVAAGVLLRDLPAKLRRESVDPFVELLESFYGRSQAPRPAWLEGLRERLKEEVGE